MPKQVSIDAYTVQVIGYILMFLVSSLIAIIVWLAKTVIRKVDSIVLNQEGTQLGIELLRGETRSIKEDMAAIKSQHSEQARRLGELETLSARNAEWIRMTERQNNRS